MKFSSLTYTSSLKKRKALVFVLRSAISKVKTSYSLTKGTKVRPPRRRLGKN